MKYKQRGFALIEIIITIVVVAVIGLIGWMAYNASQQQSSNDSASTSEQAESAAAATNDEGYLVVEEWGVRLKKGAFTADAEYVVKSENVIFLSTKTYADKTNGACTPGALIGQLVRGRAGFDYNGSGNGIENYAYEYVDDSGAQVKVASKRIGEYYYFWQGSDAPCAEPTSANVTVMNTYQQALSDLAYTVEAIPEQ